VAVPLFYGGAWAADALQPTDTRSLHYELADAKTGSVLNTVWGWTEPVEGEPNAIAAVSQTLFARGGEWRQRVVFTRDRPPRCLSWDGIFTSAAGAVLVTNHTLWAADEFPLLSEPFPPTTYPMEGMGYALTHLDLGTQEKTSIHTMFGGTLAQVDLWIDGRERVGVPAGEFECHRVRMRANAHSLFPNLPAFLHPVLSFFIPTYTAWLTVSEPQTLVKFTGQMGPPGSPDLLMRLLAVRD